MFGNINPCTSDMITKKDPRSCDEQTWKMFCATNNHPICKKRFDLKDLKRLKEACNGKFYNICGNKTDPFTCALTFGNLLTSR